MLNDILLIVEIVLKFLVARLTPVLVGLMAFGAFVLMAGADGYYSITCLCLGVSLLLIALALSYIFYRLEE